jgi:demethylspheroidene O-methyltransferase
MAPPGSPGGVSRWRDRLAAWRDRTVADPRFQRLAAGLPFTGWVARRRAAALFDLVAGFVYSQVLLSCVRLEVFEHLAGGPLTPAQLGPRIGLNEAATERLLAAAVSLKLLAHRGHGRIGLGPLGAPMVGNTALIAMIEHHATLYADLRDPVALLRGQSGPRGMAAYWPYAEHVPVGAEGRLSCAVQTASPAAAPGAAATRDQARYATYSALMAATQPMVAEQVLDAYPFGRHRRLLDVGGGDGSFLAAVAARHPALELMLFDLPAVAELGRRRLAERGLAARSQVVGGSFFDDPLPRGADLVSLVRVIFDHSDERALRILTAVRQALPPGGTLVLAEPMARTPGAEAMGDAYFGFYLLAMGRGRPRSADELSALMQAAGFTGVRLLGTRLPLQARVLQGRVPLRR